MHPQVERWKAHEGYQSFMRQLTTDIHVALKNRWATESECKQAVHELCGEIFTAFPWTPVGETRRDVAVKVSEKS